MARLGRTAMLAAAALLAPASPASASTEAGAAAGIEISLSPTGEQLGPMTAQTRFSAAELSSVFAGAVVTEATGATEGEPYPILQVADRHHVLLEVRSADGSAIHSVEIMPGTPVEGLGVRHGQTYAEVFGAERNPACWPGTEEYSGQVLCPAPASDHLVLIFDGIWDGPDGELPSPGVLREWSVERLIWRPWLRSRRWSEPHRTLIGCPSATNRTGSSLGGVERRLDLWKLAPKARQCHGPAEGDARCPGSMRNESSWWSPWTTAARSARSRAWRIPGE